MAVVQGFAWLFKPFEALVAPVLNDGGVEAGTNVVFCKPLSS
jgi:hypothetical protein